MHTLLTYALLCLLCTACTAPASRDALPDIAPDEQPAKATDEGGLWMRMNRAEEQLKTSGIVVNDPALTSYVKNVTCRLAGPYCNDIRVYVVRMTHFNASMAPNGMLQVWTGLLLRTQSEAQLAYILGHELGHYLRRHSLQIWQDVRQKTALRTYFSLAGILVGLPGYAYDLTDLAMAGGVFKFSRDNEREADEIGFELMAAAGYDPNEAAKLWQRLIEERDASKEPTPWIFFSTHPSTEQRVNTLRELAQAKSADGKIGLVGEQRYAAAIAPWRTRLLRDELRQRQFSRTQIVLGHLMDTGTRLGELHFFQGELYRLRADDGDGKRAMAAYKKATEYDDCPPDVYRVLGLSYMKSGDRERARISFQRYLETQPQAKDSTMIEAYLKKLE